MVTLRGETLETIKNKYENLIIQPREFIDRETYLIVKKFIFMADDRRDFNTRYLVSEKEHFLQEGYMIVKRMLYYRETDKFYGLPLYFNDH